MLQKLQRLGVRVALHGETLKVQAPKGVLTPALRARLVEQKAALLTLLSSWQLLTDKQETPPVDMPQEEVHTTYARLQDVTKVHTPLGPGIIFPYTPLALQMERGRIGVLLECPSMPVGDGWNTSFLMKCRVWLHHSNISCARRERDD